MSIVLPFLSTNSDECPPLFLWLLLLSRFSVIIKTEGSDGAAQEHFFATTTKVSAGMRRLWNDPTGYV